MTLSHEFTRRLLALCKQYGIRPRRKQYPKQTRPAPSQVAR